MNLDAILIARRSDKKRRRTNSSSVEIDPICIIYDVLARRKMELAIKAKCGLCDMSP